jgi:hypothetical protein
MSLQRIDASPRNAGAKSAAAREWPERSKPSGGAPDSA